MPLVLTADHADDVRSVRLDDGNRVGRGLVEEGPDGPRVRPWGGDVFSTEPRTAEEATLGLDEVRLLAPVVPSKIVVIGQNYIDHAAELGHTEPETLRVFLKAPSSVVGPGEPIVLPEDSGEVHYEAELGVVIGRRCRRVTQAEALDCVWGYTCANDVTARDIQRSTGLVSYAKSFDTFCPLGPWVETDLDPADLRITCTVNGLVRKDGSTASMVWGVAELVERVSAAMTLLPGDVVVTGTPAGVGALAGGDEVSVSIEGIGTLTNPVIGPQAGTQR